MKRVQRVLTTIAVTALLGLGSGALATPAAAETDISLLGGAVAVTGDGHVGVRVMGQDIVVLPVSLDGIA
ncbi:hypothetical protein AB0A70_06235 [Streptomyces morookaense]|uniref:hypothetical protein n=1 Tax=Streptomyces morookaense TaxID=1970 RepID=UPI0033EC0992